MHRIHSQLDPYFQKRTAQEQFSGVVRITQGDEELFSGTYGYASRAWQIPNTLETRFDTASITKLFTAVAILQLIDQGRLSFDTKVIDLVGIDETTISRDVTVYHLLTHTSGIGDDAEEEAGEDYADLWINKPNYSVRTTRDMLPQFIHKPANFPPGERCRYCNVGYILLGLVIETICGVEYRDHIREHIFAKAGMDHTDFLNLDHVNENMAEGADPIFDENENIIGWKRNIYSFPPVGAPESGAHVTAGDLDRFLRSVQRGELLSPELTQAFLMPKVHYRDREGWTMQYGYGMWFYVDDAGEIVCYQKEGVNAGVSNAMRYFPKDDINVVILTNMEDAVWEPIRKVHDIIVGR